MKHLTLCKGFSCPAGSTASPSIEQISATNITGSGLQILAALGQIGDNFSEDCLTLNIWTKPQVGEQKKAVLLWIYGGGFTTGNSDNPGYNGQYIAEQEDVVLVSINYRLNVFGFPGSPNGTYNLGLLDQRLAVEWVRDNIASFGGDPSRITLFGQSAGSASVDYYTYAWADDPIAHSFIQESGSVFGPSGGLGALPTNQSNAYWFNLTSALSCGGATSDQTTVLSCLKKKSTAEVLFALKEITPVGAGGLSTSFAPTVDEKVVFGNYTERSQAGKFAKLPLLLGNADYEAGLFKVLLAFENMTEPDVYWDGFNNIAFTCPCAARANVSISNNVPSRTRSSPRFHIPEHGTQVSCPYYSTPRLRDQDFQTTQLLKSLLDHICEVLGRRSQKIRLLDFPVIRMDGRCILSRKRVLFDWHMRIRPGRIW